MAKGHINFGMNLLNPTQIGIIAINGNKMSKIRLLLCQFTKIAPKAPSKGSRTRNRKIFTEKDGLEELTLMVTEDTEFPARKKAIMKSKVMLAPSVNIIGEDDIGLFTPK